MKKIYVLFIALSALLLTGCENDPIIYNGPDFVSFSEKTISKVVRSEADGMVTIEVGCANKSNEARTFTVSVDAANTTAVEGTDFDFVSKSVTIPAGEYVGKIQIKGNYDNLTPEGVTLTLKLDADASMIQEGTTHSVRVNLSRFFEFNMDWLVGAWLAQDVRNGAVLDMTGYGDFYDVEIEKVDENTIVIKGFFQGLPSELEATVDWDNGTISIPIEQYVFTNGGSDHRFFFNIAGSSLVDAPVVGEVNYNGIVTGSYAILNASLSGWFPIITTMKKVEE